MSVETSNGPVTARLSERTDDAMLKAAVPHLLTKRVESVVLHAASVRDISPLSAMTGLKMLDISGSMVRDLAPISKLTGLESLDLQFLPVTDLGPLAGLTKLRALNLDGTDIRDLTPLTGLTELRELAATVTKIRDLTPIASLRELTSLNLGSTWVAETGPLAEMTSLRFLSLNGTPVIDVQPLAHLGSLRTLDLGGTQVSDIRPLAGLHELRSLNLEGTRVADLTPLAGLTALRSVEVGGSHVQDMTPLARRSTAPQGQPNPRDSDPVLVWNDLTNQAIQLTGTDAFEAPRALAMESIAVLDTIKSIDGTPAFLVRLPAPRDIPVTIAVASTAHAMLSHLFPTQRAVFDAALDVALAHEPADPTVTRAVEFGNAVADAVIMLRDHDGSMETGDGGAGSAPGKWRPTPPGYLPASHPQWARLQPFALTRPDQFRPAGPPALGTEAFRAARAEVMALGALESTVRTAEQTEIAQYWSDAIGTYAPAGHWNAIANTIVAPLHLGMAVEAELFAELNVAIADAAIAVADAKYTYRFWRPITAIRAGDSATPPAPDWTSLLQTPNHPSYVSGHSGFSGAAAAVLTAWFGSRPFTFTSASLPGVTRSFTSFQQAAEEAAISRVYGGIHYGFDNMDGLATGRQVGAWTMAVFEKAGQDRGPIIMMLDHSMPMANVDPDAVAGCAMDNLSPLTAVTVRLDGGTPFDVAVDNRGIFTVPAERLGSQRRHTAMVTATDAAGHSHTLRVEIE